jgi:uncharacterized protein with HEPN domain
MSPGREADAAHLALILELIRLVQEDLAGLSEADFLVNRNLSDLTAYRLSTIGESTHRLSDELKLRHPEIAWSAIYRMRNIVAHHYQRVRRELVWAIAANSLEALAAVCRHELAQLNPEHGGEGEG